MMIGLTADLVRLRTIEPSEAQAVARLIAAQAPEFDEPRLLQLLRRFPEGQIVAFGPEGQLRGWVLHRRAPRTRFAPALVLSTFSLWAEDAPTRAGLHAAQRMLLDRLCLSGTRMSVLLASKVS